MKVYILAANAFEARDLGRMLGLPVQETVILNSEAATRLQRPQNGDLVLETATAGEHPEYAAMKGLVEDWVEGLDIRWEREQ
jgi:hypothetical protein